MADLVRGEGEEMRDRKLRANKTKSRCEENVSPRAVVLHTTHQPRRPPRQACAQTSPGDVNAGEASGDEVDALKELGVSVGPTSKSKRECFFWFGHRNPRDLTFSASPQAEIPSTECPGRAWCHENAL